MNADEMPRHELKIFPNPETLFAAAAELICATLQARLQSKDGVAFVLTGGVTPKPVYERLAKSPYLEGISWERIDFFWGDERCVSPDHADSNYRMAWETLLSRVPTRSDRIHRIPGELEDHEKAAFRYEAEIRRVLPGESIPRFDLALLGMGEDGHTASLFPGTTWDESRLVVSNFVPRLKSWRITLTPRLLNQTNHVMFLVSGTSKAKALRDVLEDPLSDYPAKKIRPVSGTLTWMLDRTAASLLAHKDK